MKIIIIVIKQNPHNPQISLYEKNLICLSHARSYLMEPKITSIPPILNTSNQSLSSVHGVSVNRRAHNGHSVYVHHEVRAKGWFSDARTIQIKLMMISE